MIAERSSLARANPNPLAIEQAIALLERTDDVDAILEIRDFGELAVEYARRKRAGIEAQNRARRLVLSSMRRLGQRLPELVARGNPQMSSPSTFRRTLEEMGITRDESSRAQKLAAIPDHVFEAHCKALDSRGELLTLRSTINAASSAPDYDGDEHYTPGEWCDRMRAVMGGIDLDPASNTFANRTMRARRYFTSQQNGLAKRWSGRVALNSPYSQPLESRFTAKLCESWDRGWVTQAIRLSNAATDTRSFHECATRAARLCFVRGRINFYTRKGPTNANRYAGQLFYYFGDRVAAFDRIFGEHGTVLRGRNLRADAARAEIERLMKGNDDG